METLPTTILSQPGSPIILDGGQNLAGFVRLRVKGKSGDQITVRHAEVLESDGALHTRSLRSAKATDVYILADEAEVDLEPIFTFHGFRYAEVESEAELVSSEIVAISSDLPRRVGSSAWNRLSTSCTRTWSGRNGKLRLGTHRLPATGRAIGLDRRRPGIRPYGLQPLRVRAVLGELAGGSCPGSGRCPWCAQCGSRCGPWWRGSIRAGWVGRAAAFVPWAVYESYGDTEILRRRLDSMRRWVDSLVNRRDDDGLLASTFQFGDWLDPDAPSDRPWEAKAGSTFLANAFFSRSARRRARRQISWATRHLALATACWPMPWPTPPGPAGRSTSSRHRPGAPSLSASESCPK